MSYSGYFDTVREGNCTNTHELHMLLVGKSIVRLQQGENESLQLLQVLKFPTHEFNFRWFNTKFIRSCRFRYYYR